jgi:hypothetical protein
MKKIIVVFAFIVMYTVSQAQINMPKVDVNGATSALSSFVKPPAIGDITKTTGSVVDMLTSKLGLPASQKTDLTNAVSGFLTQKKGITSLANTDPTGYLAKFNPLQQGLFGKLKGIMGTSAFTKLMSLKPSGNNIAGNALSHLFF